MLYAFLFVLGICAFLFGLYALIVFRGNSFMMMLGIILIPVGLGFAGAAFYFAWQIFVPIFVVIVLSAVIIIFALKAKKAERKQSEKYEATLNTIKTTYVDFFNDCLANSVDCDTNDDEFMSIAESYNLNNYENACEAYFKGKALVEVRSYYDENDLCENKDIERQIADDNAQSDFAMSKEEVKSGNRNIVLNVEAIIKNANTYEEFVKLFLNDDVEKMLHQKRKIDKNAEEIKKKQYEQAMSLIEEQNFEDAYEILVGLGKYEDAESKVIEIENKIPTLSLLDFTLIKGGCAVKAKDVSLSGNIVIPSTHKGLVVLCIAENGFKGAQITGITIPDSVTSIGYRAFAGCGALTDISLGNGVTKIGIDAFKDTAFFNNDNNWEDDILYIDNCLVSARKTISGGHNIKSGVRLVANFAFYNCRELKSITITDSVKRIGYGAFYGCCSLESITLPYVDENFGYIFGASSYSSNAEFLPKSLKTIAITGGTCICSNAFFGCSQLKNITIPDSVTFIGKDAFRNCNGLIHSSRGIKYVDKWVIDRDYSSNGVTLRDDTKGIADSAFNSCSWLKSIVIPDSVTSIGNSAFENCSELTSVVLGRGVTSIGISAFDGCKKLTSINVPESITSIGSYVFNGCSKLTGVTIPEGVVSIGNGAFKNCGELTSLIIPEGVTSIGYNAFENCRELTRVTIPKSVTSIVSGAFDGCSKLTRVVIPSGITEIESSTFNKCGNLASVTIPDSVISIDDFAFGWCGALTNITFKGTKKLWRTMSKGNDWDYGTVKYTIHCTDGDIAKS